MRNRLEIMPSIPEDEEVNFYYDWTKWLDEQHIAYRSGSKKTNKIYLSFYKEVMKHRR